MNTAWTSCRLGAAAARAELHPARAAAVATLSLFAVAAVSLLEADAAHSEALARAAHAFALRGGVFGLVLPIAAFVVAGHLAPDPSRVLAAPWARHGADRRAYALGRLAFAALVLAALGVALGLTGFVLTRAATGALAPQVSVPRELLALVWIGAAGGAAYAAVFALAAAWAGRIGIAAALLGDWLLGAGVGTVALPWPRAHLRALLGGAAAFDFGPWSSSAALVALIVVASLLYAARFPR